eukprot:9468455-Pyramimonas_sp.AAC.1
MRLAQGDTIRAHGGSNFGSFVGLGIPKTLPRCDSPFNYRRARRVGLDVRDPTASKPRSAANLQTSLQRIANGSLAAVPAPDP